MALALELLLSGLGVGAVYAIVAMGYNVEFATTGVLNFAQGEFFMLGTMIGVVLAVALDLPVVVALVVTLAVVALIAAVEEPLAVRPASRSGQGAFGWVIATFGFAIVLSSTTSLVLGSTVRTFPPALELGTIEVGEVVVDLYRMFLVALAAAAAVALHLLMVRTPVGLALSAVHQDREAAQLRGLAVGRLAILAFAIGGGVVALGGFLAAPVTTASATIGLTIGLKGFIAAALGGIPSIRGALVGGLLLGVIETVGGHVAGGGYRNLVIFAVLILVLVVRPAGLFGRGDVRAV